MMDIIRNGTTEKLSESTQFGTMVFLSGKLPTDLTQDIRVQATSVLENIEQALIKANSGKDRLLFAQIFLKHHTDDVEFNRIWNQWLPAGCAPARICVETNMLNNDVLVELYVVAAVK